MYRIMHSSSIPTRAVSVALLCSLGAACTTVQTVQPAEYIPKHAPDVVWVTAADKTVVPVTDPQVAGDTLTGTRKGTKQQVSVPLQNVQSVTIKKPDPGKTAMLVAGLTLFSAVMLREYWIANEGPNHNGVDCGVYDTATTGHAAGSPRPDC